MPFALLIGKPCSEFAYLDSPREPGKAIPLGIVPFWDDPVSLNFSPRVLASGVRAIALAAGTHLYSGNPMQAPAAESVHALHHRFLTVLPRIETHARIAFRRVRCPDTQDDCVQEAIAISWKWFVRTTEQGKDPTQFVSTIATLAVAHVRCHRKLVKSESARDAMSPLAQRRHGFTVASIPQKRTPESSLIEEALQHSETPVPDQVAFRIDFPVWLDTLAPLKNRIATDLMTGERTGDLAEKHHVTPSRVSQLRNELFASWEAFTSDC